MSQPSLGLFASSSGSAAGAQIDLESGLFGASDAHNAPSAGASQPQAGIESLFIYDCDLGRIEKMEPGWARLAAENNCFRNQRTYRKFGPLVQTICFYLQRKISHREEYIETMLRNASGARPDSDAEGGEASRAGCSFSDMEDFLEGTRRDLMNYFQLVWMGRKLDSMPMVSLPHHKELYKWMRNFHGLDEDACAFMHRPNDTVIDSDVEHSITNSLLYPREGSIIPRFVGPLIRRAINPLSRDDFMDVDRLAACLGVSIVVLCVVLLVTPVAVLLLVPMEKWKGLLVITLCVLTITPILCFIKDRRIATSIVGVSAYLAVLVTFLAQGQNFGQ